MINGSDKDYQVRTLAQLEALYDAPSPNSLAKEIDHLNAPYRALIEASPFFALATSGPDGLDCSPRGDAAGFVRVVDPKTLLVPDRRGNNRIDSLRNIVDEPRVALLFMIPGCSETLRVNGRAVISTDPKLTESFVVDGKVPRVVLVIAVERVYFQCAKALVRSKLWDAATWRDRTTLPSTGKILAAITDGKAGGEAHDREYPARIKATLY